MDSLVESIVEGCVYILSGIIDFHHTLYTLIILSLFRLDMNNYYKFLEYYLVSFIKYVPADIIFLLTVLTFYIFMISIIYLICKIEKLCMYVCCSCL